MTNSSVVTLPSTSELERDTRKMNAAGVFLLLCLVCACQSSNTKELLKRLLESFERSKSHPKPSPSAYPEHTDRPFTTTEGPEEPFEGNTARIIHKIRKELDQRYGDFDENYDVTAFPTGQPFTDDPLFPDNDLISPEMIECLMNDVMKDYFKGFPKGPISGNLNIDVKQITYILESALREYKLGDGDETRVLTSVIKRLAKMVLEPHKSCPATKFHQVIVWSGKQVFKFIISNHTDSLKSKFVNILSELNFDAASTESIATYSVKELHRHLLKKSIRVLKAEFYRDFMDGMFYVINEVVTLFDAPKSTTAVKIRQMLETMAQFPSWLQCTTPERIITINQQLIYRMKKFVEYEEFNEFLDRAEDVLNEEFEYWTGAEQLPVVKKMLAALETNVWEIINGTMTFTEFVITSDYESLKTSLSNLMNSKQTKYFEWIVKQLVGNPRPTSPAPIAPKTPGVRVVKEHRQKVHLP